MIHNLLQYNAWAIDEAFASEWLPKVMSGHIERFIHKQTPEDLIARVDNLLGMGSEAVALSSERDSNTGLPMVKSNGKNIAVIPIIGPLTKYGDLCNMGMQGYQSMINKANASPSIDGIVIILDTPGGTVDGTPELGLSIATSGKPVGIFGDGMVASAGMWLASQAAVIVGNKNNPTQFGNIGALRMLKNFANVIEQGNMEQVHIITAPQSTEKVSYNPFVPITQAIKDQVKEEVRPMAQMIIDAVKTGRGNRLDNKVEGVFAGRMFDSNKAKQIGLIDSVGTLQTAINKVADLAREKQRAVNSPGQGLNSGINSNANNMKFPKLSALFSGEAWGKALSAFTDDEKPLEAAEQKVAEMELNLTTATAEKQAAEVRATEASSKVTELTAQVSALTGEKAALETTVKEQKEALDKKPTGSLTTIIPAATEQKQATDLVGVQQDVVESKTTMEARDMVTKLDALKKSK